MTKEQMLELLRKDVVPALGCTEPVCVALCAAQAGAVLDGTVDSIHVEVNPGIYKNAMSAGIPGCSMVGIPWAAAIGANLKNPAKQLQLLADLTPEILADAENLISADNVTVTVKNDEKSIYVRCVIHSSLGEAVSITRGSHTNMVYLSCNGEILFEKPASTASASDDPLVDALQKLTVAQILNLVESASEEELTFMTDGIDMNDALAAYSETNPIGIGLAGSLKASNSLSLLGSDLISRITYAVTSAAESRLDGCPFPTMSSSGAGTKGLVVILPISETARAIGADKLHTVRAIALGHLVNRYINAFVGKLSPMCTSCVLPQLPPAALSICWAAMLRKSDLLFGICAALSPV